METRAIPPGIGDLVVIHDPELAQTLGRAEQPGVVLHRRRGDARVAFLPDAGTAWVEDARLFRLDAGGELPLALRRIGLALRSLDATEAELRIAGEHRIELELLCTGFSHSTLRGLERELGPAFLDCELRPYGMAQLGVLLSLAMD